MTQHTLQRSANWFLSAAFLAALATTAHGQFTTVVTTPPDVLGDFSVIGSDTQVNILPGSEPVRWLRIGSRSNPADNVEINLLGGTLAESLRTSGRSAVWSGGNANVAVNVESGLVEGNLIIDGGALGAIRGGTIDGYVRGESGSLVRIAGGEIRGGAWAADGGLLLVSGGTFGQPGYYGSSRVGATGGSALIVTGGEIGTIGVVGGSTAAISGGALGDIGVTGGSVATLSGGSFGDLSALTGGRFQLVGGDFQINGAPVGEPTYHGAPLAVDLGDADVLTGTLADGSPVILSNQGNLGDALSTGTLQLLSSPVPAHQPQTYVVPQGTAPRGLHSGDRLVVDPGGSVGDNLRASWGSVIELDGGAIGNGLRAVGATVNVADGSLGEQTLLYHDAILNLSGGAIGSNLSIGHGATLNMAGGRIATAFEALDGSTVNIAGGAIEQYFQAHAGSAVTIAGSGFRVNGMPLPGLATPGETLPFDVPMGAVLSGTLADGTQFAVANGVDEHFAPGVLKLSAAVTPAPGPAVVRVPQQPAPAGLRPGQILHVAAGGQVGDLFTADWASVVTMTDGAIGDQFQAVGALVNISGGRLGHGSDAYFGSVVNISGGEVGNNLAANSASIVNITGGTVGSYLTANTGGVVNIKGASVIGSGRVNPGGAMHIADRASVRRVEVQEGALTISGGQVAGSVTAHDAQVVLSGGAYGDGFSATEESRVTLSGHAFRVDGGLVDGFTEYGGSVAIELPPDSVLSGVFDDGTPFAFSSADRDHFDPGVLFLSQPLRPTLIPVANPIIIPGLPGAEPTPPLGLPDGESLSLAAGEAVGDNFVAGWDSTLTVNGGTVGDNLELVGARFTLNGGRLGDYGDAFIGSEVEILAGTVGSQFEAHAGSRVQIRGGEVDDLFLAHDGSEVNISGGTVDGLMIAESGSKVTLAGGLVMSYDFITLAGSEIHLIGTDFLLNGQLIVGLAPGEPFVLNELDGRNGALATTLADGSPFRWELPGMLFRDNPGFGEPAPLISLTLLATSDFNASGTVDGGDLAAWQSAFGASDAADANSDGASDGGDFLAWQRQWRRIGTPTNYAVPEPGSGILLVAAGLASMVQWRQRTTAERSAAA